MRSSSVADRTVGWLLPALAIVAEGALLAVVYVAVETTIDHRAPLLGAFELAAAAAVAALAVHRGWITLLRSPPGQFQAPAEGLMSR